MKLWGKLYRILSGKSCAECGSPLKGARTQTCSPLCEQRREEMQAFSI